MNGGGAVAILVVGLGAAAFLYYRSQQQQAAAVAAAQAAPTAGFLKKLENLGSAALKSAPSTLVHTTANNVLNTGGWTSLRSIATGNAGNIAKTAASGVTSAVSFVKGLI